MASGYEIRRFETLEEYRACVDLQEAIWGRGFSERVAVAILKVSQRIGGIAAGAYDDSGELAGFVFGMTGVEDGGLVHWSDMLGVRPGLRDSGLGTELKWYQRSEMLALGVKTILWTFDPLQSRNAHLNFNKLGIVAREYIFDMYGDTDSHLHAGIGTDRLVAVWELDSERVERTRRGQPIPMGAPTSEALGLVVDGSWPEPGELRLDASALRVRVAIPGNLDALKADSLERAVRWREATRAALTHYLSAGYEVVGFGRHQRGYGYLLERPLAGGSAEGTD